MANFTPQNISKSNMLYLELTSSLFLAQKSPQEQGVYLNFLNEISNGKYLHQEILNSKDGITEAEFANVLEDADAIDVLNLERIPPNRVYTRYETLVAPDTGMIQNTFRLNVNLAKATFDDIIALLELVNVLSSNLSNYKRANQPMALECIQNIFRKSPNRF